MLGVLLNLYWFNFGVWAYLFAVLVIEFGCLLCVLMLLWFTGVCVLVVVGVWVLGPLYFVNLLRFAGV